jgi:thioredoxin 1
MFIKSRAYILAISLGLNSMLCTTEQKLEKWFHLHNKKDEIAKSFAPVLDMMAQQLSVAEDAKAGFVQDVLDTWFEEFKKAFVKTYGAHFNDEELDAIIAYYESPAGIKLSSLRYQLEQEMMPVYQGFNKIAIDKSRELAPKKAEAEKDLSNLQHFENIVNAKRYEKMEEVEVFKNVLQSKKGLIAVKFSAFWCGPCKVYAPIFEEVSNELTDIEDGEDMIQLHYIAIDGDQFAKVREHCKIMSYPTTLFYKDGVLIETKSGLMHKEALIEKIKELALKK